MNCPKCYSLCDETDNFCRRCGKSLKPGTGFLYSHSGIILLAVILGPFALPAVWGSKLISTAAKWIYTVVLLLIAVYLAVACWHAYLLATQAAQTFLGAGL